MPGIVVLALLSVGWLAPLSLAANLPPLAYRLAVGETLVYKLHYTSSSISDFRVLFGKPPAPEKGGSLAPGLASSIDTKVAGKFSATVLDRNNHGILITYRFRNLTVEFKVNGQEAVSEAARITRDLSAEIFAQATRQGRVISVRFDPQVGHLSQSFARALIAATQFVLPSAQTVSRPKWEVEEEDPNGRYLGRYEIIEAGGEPGAGSAVLTIRKTKLKYLKAPSELAPGRAELPAQVLPSGSLVGRFDRTAGHLISLQGSESQAVEIADRPVSRTQTTVRLDFSHTEKLSASHLASARQASAAREKLTTAVPLWWREPDTVSETALHRRTLGAATLDDLLVELQGAESAGVKPPGPTQLYLKLKALIYLQPAVSERLAGILAEAAPNSLTMSLLAGALGAVGHPEAQAALVSVLRKRSHDVEAQALLIRPLTAATAPTPLAEEALRDRAFRSSKPEIASGAQLALGTMARNLLRSSPERSAAIVDSLVGHFGKKPVPGQAMQLLRALGNTGSERALPVIRRFLADASPQLRATAAGALRFIEGNESDSLLAKALAEDTETAVRLEAAQGLSYRPMTPQTFAAQKQAFRNEKEGQVRLVVLENLWWARQKFPEARELVMAAARDETSPEVRKKASWLLASDR